MMIEDDVSFDQRFFHRLEDRKLGIIQFKYYIMKRLYMDLILLLRTGKYILHLLRNQKSLQNILPIYYRIYIVHSILSFFWH